MDDIKIIWNWILVDKKSKVFIFGHKAIEKPKYGNNGKEKDSHDKLEWVAWGKELPDDIDDGGYILKKGELVKSAKSKKK